MGNTVDHSGAPVAVVFGGRSPIALACARKLSHTQDVILVTRRIDEDLETAVEGISRLKLMQADLEIKEASARLISTLYDSQQKINALIFLQRYRASGEQSYERHCAVELWSIEEALAVIKTRKQPKDHVRVLISSSPAAQNVLLDQDLQYHLVKAGQEALTRYLAAFYGRDAIDINAVRIGSIVLKERAMAYWTSKPVMINGLKAMAPVGTLLSSDSVGAFFADLTTSSLKGLSGQIIDLDNGFSLLDGSQIAKELLSSTESI